MTGTALQDPTPDIDEDARPPATDHTSAKQSAIPTRAPASVRYLSDFIGDIPETRRIKFIVNLKTAIREGQFDGSPIAETFALHYTGRGSEGPEGRETDQRNFVVDHTPAFEAWLANEAQEISTRPKYPSRVQLEGGEISVAELAEKFRQRGGTSVRRKAKR